MSSSRSKVGPINALPGRVVLTLLVAAIMAFVMLTAFKALDQAFDQDDFPEALAVKVELLPFVFPVHMLTGALALILVPLAYSLRRRPAAHRIAGRLAAADVLIAGVTALPVAWVAPVSPWSAAGFIAQACTWLALLVLGIASIRAGRIAAHQRYMLLMAATTSGAVFFRVYLALWALLSHGRHFVAFYACDSWIAWLLPLAATAFTLKRWRIAVIS